MKEVKRARQLTLDEKLIKTILMSDNNIPKNKESALFSQMKVGNQKLYLDVTSKVNGLIERAIYTTKTQLVNEVFLTQLLADGVNLTQLPQNLLTGKATGMNALFIFCTSLIFNGIHFLNLYFSQWKHNVQNHGAWDFKRNTEPFKSGSQNNMSPFFWYNGYRGKQYKLFPHHKAGLLRFDDVGNMCYAATGKIMISSFDNIVEKFILRLAAEIVAFDENSLKEFWKPIYTQLEDGLTRQWFDDPWDMKVIEWTYDIPFTEKLQFTPFQAFNLYCNFFNIKPNN